MADANPQSPEAAYKMPRWRLWLRPTLVGIVFLVLNVVVYLVLRTPAGRQVLRQLGSYNYLGTFVLMAVANATVIVPVPYAGVLIAIAQAGGNLPLIILAGALGSAVGESVAFFVGRAGRGAVEETRFYRWVSRQLRHPWRAFLVLFLLSAPPNPLFDVAGLTAGAVGVPFWMFFSAVALGRIIRVGIFVLLGVGLLS
jgi:membrane protein YqaA with SNARE-associated domain